MRPQDNPKTVDEALELAGRYPDAECWQEYTRKVTGTPKPLPGRFLERLAATIAEDPGTFGRLVLYALQAVRRQEGGADE